MKVGNLVEVDFVDMTGVGTGNPLCGLVVEYVQRRPILNDPSDDEVCVLIDNQKHWFYVDEVRVISESR